MLMVNRILITGAFAWSKEQIAELKQMGYELIYVEREDGPLPDEAYSANVVVCNWLFANHSIEKFTDLKGIQLLSAGIDRVPLEYIKKNKIKLFSARGVYSIPMAEYAIGGVLQLLKKSENFIENKNKHCWTKNRDIRELNGMSVLILGAGSVGIEVAKRFSAFTNDVYGIDICPNNQPYFKCVYQLSELESIISKSDIVVLTLPLNQETYHMFDQNLLDQMKDDSILVNIARGALVNQRDLISALDSKLYGAVLDVFETEPLPPDDPLWKKRNVVLSPHNSFVSDKNGDRMWNVIRCNLGKIVE